MLHLLRFHGNSGYAEASQCYAVRTWPVLFCFNLVQEKALRLDAV
jgi:hypothetical protein